MSTTKEKANLNRVRQEIAGKYKCQISARDERIATLTTENKTLQVENAELKAQLEAIQKAVNMSDDELNKFRQNLRRIDNMAAATAKFEKLLGPLAALASYT